MLAPGWAASWPDRPEEPDPFARWFDYDGSNGAAINKMLGEQGQLAQAALVWRQRSCTNDIGV